MRVIGYMRVSTDRQAADDKYGLEAQRADIVAYCEKEQWEIIDWVVDKGESGARERPGFDEIIYGDVANPPVEKVVVGKSDRVARDIEVYYYYKMMLRKKDIELVSVAEDFGKMGAFAHMLEGFTICVAEMERANINKRTSSGRRIKASKGGYSGGTAPYGYRAVKGELVVVPEEAEAVRKIFAMREEGKSYREICRWLTENGYKTHRGSDFAPGTLTVIFNNEKTYKGMYKYGNSDWVKGQQEPILTE